jgi:predicted Zn-dependent protease with MMP-like domain
VEFEESVEAALETLPDDLREAMSNVAIVVEDEPGRRRTRSRSTAARSSGSTATIPS